MPKSPMNVKDSSLDGEFIKTRMAKLTRTNWVQWNFQFENYLISKGMDDLLEPPSEDVKQTAKFKKKNSGELTLLWSSVSTQFEGILLNNKSSFHNCWISLGNCCGKNSVVVICCTLHKLINLKYEPATSLEKHIADLHKIYASYLSISADSTVSMNLSSSMAAAFFLQSLDSDKELSSLCQTLYDIEPFNINSVTDRVAIEHSRRQSAYDHHALLFDKNKQAESSQAKPKNPAEASCKKKGFKDKNKGRTNNQNTNHENDTNKRIEIIEQLLERLQAANNISSVNAMSESKEPTRPTTSDSEAFILDEKEVLRSPPRLTALLNILIKHSFLGQSNIPIAYWGEAASHSSLLLNMLPHKHLNMKSPTMVLKKKHSLIELEIDFARLVPFGIRVTTKILNPTSRRGKVRVSQDYQPAVGGVVPSMHQPSSVIPTSHSLEIKLQIPASHPVSTTPLTKKSKKYDYLPYYKEAPKTITSSISQDDIMVGKRNICHPDQLLLTDAVPYSQAIIDPIEGIEWKKAMDTKYELLMSHNTGELVPYPEKPTKVIGGMWRLTCKRNEYGEVYRHKACWVVLGNHQEHMLHYYGTWALVGWNETFKVMLLLVVNFKYIPYQFYIKTSFLHGEMDVVVYVKQVKGYEEKGKESWVWRLKKSLYGTKQAPGMWKSKLTSILNSFGLTSTWSDESSFINIERNLLLHEHVNDGFIISQSEEKIIAFLTKSNSIPKLKFKKKPTQHLGYTLKWSTD
ncbi:hypothetical protein O181_008284 [Austropuccinia psidii MF-1]|uniref:Reverse transcriptase Ty1/copia-type domain-containing protein n=1 Tax=Austropuccinia psidii MF-1 TaxID=1389203 RepID=A0A9Q3BMC6_9BASI|nr:hypothetical protein [Austropuccinia psidii MF-1]